MLTTDNSFLAGYVASKHKLWDHSLTQWSTIISEGKKHWFPPLARSHIEAAVLWCNYKAFLLSMTRRRFGRGPGFAIRWISDDDSTELICPLNHEAPLCISASAVRLDSLFAHIEWSTRRIFCLASCHFRFHYTESNTISTGDSIFYKCCMLSRVGQFWLFVCCVIQWLEQMSLLRFVAI